MPSNWHVATASDGRRILVRGGELSVHVRDTVARSAHWIGIDPATAESTAIGTACLGIVVGLLTGWLGWAVLSPAAGVGIGIALAIITALISWHLVTGRSDACLITPASSLATLVEYAEHRPTDPLDQRLRAVARYALAAVPQVSEVEQLASLPALVRSTAIAHHLAATLGVDEVLPGLTQLWAELDWTPQGVLAAAERVSALAQELTTLGRAQRAVADKVDQPVTQFREADLVDYQRKVDDTLAMGLEAVRRETAIRRATLDDI